MWKEDYLVEAIHGFLIFPALPGEEKKNPVAISKQFLAVTPAVHTPLRPQGISHSKECSVCML